MRKYVIFDFDGTLADSQEVFVSSLNKLAEKHRFDKVQVEDLEDLKKLSIKERCKMLNFPMYKMPFIIPQMYKLYLDGIRDVKLFNGVKELLAELYAKGYEIAIISSNSEENIRTFLNENQISIVSQVLCSSKIFGKDKLLNRFMKENQLSPSEIIYVGDEERDILACKKAGVDIIWVGWGYDATDMVQEVEPTYKAFEPQDILAII
ncbi:HAD-IA family hydrolase [Cytobacillus spongiae]|jgi:phosphoglycolate phosphatase|uniref:HAD-IA family hydrolase n=1 Tax=Cytobacillus spongiae TaxID=2901381 RepID=UPI001F3E7039|nr:HAD-IA family hydrolase [Cytobacillus spongiae]UII57093.1 HAD-IA family hydrolase [Cytobacillus spongiae]